MSDVKVENVSNVDAVREPSQTQSNQVTDNTQFLSESNEMASYAQEFPSQQPIPLNEIQQFLCRYTDLTTWQLSSTDSPITVLQTIDPWALFLADSNVAPKTDHFAYIRGTIEVKFDTAVPGSCYGLYALTALPTGFNNSDGYAGALPVLRPWNCLQTDHHALIDIAASENVVFQLPFLWPYDFASLPTGPAQSWMVSLTCLSPIGTSIPGGVSKGNIRIFARLLPGYEMVIPTRQGRGDDDPFSGYNPDNWTADEPVAAATKVADKYTGGKASKVAGAVSSARKNKTVSKTANTVKKYADMASKIPVIGPYASAVSAVAGSVSDFASWLGFTRENAEAHPKTVSHRSFSNVANTDGEDPSSMAALCIDNSISIDPNLVGMPSEDCASYASLFARWTLINNFVWSDTSTPGAIIFSIPVSPGYFHGTDAIWNMNPMAYVGQVFSFWRGDLEYMVYIPVSKLHRGTVQYIWEPLPYSSSASNPTNVSRNAIHDVSAERQKLLHVGYAREKPVLPYYPLPDGSTTIIPQDYVNGFLTCRVVNPLMSQNAGTSVQISVFVRSKNMHFGVPTDMQVRYNSVSGLNYMPSVTALTYQGALGDEDQLEPEMVDLVPPSSYPVSEILWGEDIQSVRVLMQKPTLWQPSSFVGAVAGTVTNFHSPIGPDPGFVNYTTWMAYFRMLFSGIACSTRYKFLTSSSQPVYATAVAIHTRDLTNGTTIAHAYKTLSPISSDQPQLGMEVITPWYGNRKYFSPYLLGYGTEPTARANGVYATNPSAGANISVFSCAGPDIRITCFMQVPQMAVSASAKYPILFQDGS